MDPFTIISLVTAGISVAGQVFAGIQGGKAAGEARDNALARRNNQRKEETLRQIRQSRIERARITAQASNTGVGGSSSAVAGSRGASSTAFQNISNINTQVSLADNASRAAQHSADAQGISVLAQGIGKIGGTIFDNRQELGSIFGTA